MTIGKRYLFFTILDSIIVLTGIYMSYFLLHPYLSVFSVPTLFISSITLLFSHHIAASYFKLYQKLWRAASVQELLSIVNAVTISVASASAVQYIIQQDIYFRVLIVTWMFHIIAIGGSRFLLRIYHSNSINKDHLEYKRTLIVGAGAAGTMVARQLLHNHSSELKPVGFVDDDKSKFHLEIYGVKVVGKLNEIPALVKLEKVEAIIIAMPSMSKQEIAEITKICVDTGVKTQIIPLIEDLMTGKVSVNEIRDVKIEDLLGREEVQLDMKVISANISGKTILVTGAGGSIGSEICRQVMRFSPKKLILLGHGENSIYLIEQELRNVYGTEASLWPIIADVQDRERIFEIMEEYRPDVIYHAAAHKHVPLMEGNPMEAVKNNIFGTKNVAEASDTFGVGNFVLVSTDKAVNPPNVMGATKRFAEMIVQNLAKSSKTKFAAVRFGNVLGSRGSVVPLFKKQIAKGGPITITDERMTRYFMTIPEASRLVIQAGTLANGGEVFVLDMGEPLKIIELAKNLIRLSGYSDGEIEIRETGIRPGEKLFEELMNESERQSEVVFPKIHVGKAVPISKLEMVYLLETIPGLAGNELKDILVGIANRKNVEIKGTHAMNVSS